MVDAASSRSHAQHYEVEAFRRLRTHFGISAASYARAFPDDLSTLGSTWRQRLKESLTEGKSGSFFYRVLSPAAAAATVDGAADGPSSSFIVKQISRREKHNLMALLPAYEEYVAHQGGRSFIQYLGCHSMTLRWAFSGKVYFVVMRNFQPVKPWLAFDLKGATANRRALAARDLHRLSDMHRRASGGGNSGGGGGGGSGGSDRGGGVEESSSRPSYRTLMDWEWMDIAMAVDVADASKLRIADTIVADARFLSSQGMLDC